MLPDSPDNLEASLYSRVSKVSKAEDFLVLHPEQVIRVIVLISGMRDPDKEIQPVLVVPVLISGISPVHLKLQKQNQRIKKFRIRLKQHLHV